MEHFWVVWQVGMVAVSATGQRLVGKKKMAGWWVALLGSVFWLTYGIACWSVGALLNGIIFGSVYAWNLWEWKREGTGMKRPLSWILTRWCAVVWSVGAILGLLVSDGRLGA